MKKWRLEIGHPNKTAIEETAVQKKVIRFYDFTGHYNDQVPEAR